MRDVPLFGGLLPSELDRVALVMNPAEVPAGDVICTEGEIGRDFYLLAAGEATVERDGETVAKLSKGDHFGELAVLDRGPRSATVRAISDCRVYVLHDESFAAVLNEVPALAQKLLAALARRLARGGAGRRSPLPGLSPRLTLRRIERGRPPRSCHRSWLERDWPDDCGRTPRRPTPAPPELSCRDSPASSRPTPRT